MFLECSQQAYWFAAGVQRRHALVRPDDTEFGREAAVLREATDVVLTHAVEIVGVDHLEYDRGLDVLAELYGIQTEDPVHLTRPGASIRFDLPLEAADVGDTGRVVEQVL